jgi:hypothetical protein
MHQMRNLPNAHIVAPASFHDCQRNTFGARQAFLKISFHNLRGPIQILKGLARCALGHFDHQGVENF